MSGFPLALERLSSSFLLCKSTGSRCPPGRNFRALAGTVLCPLWDRTSEARLRGTKLSEAATSLLQGWLPNSASQSPDYCSDRNLPLVTGARRTGRDLLRSGLHRGAAAASILRESRAGRMLGVFQDRARRKNERAFLSAFPVISELLAGWGPRSSPEHAMKDYLSKSGAQLGVAKSRSPPISGHPVGNF